MSDHIYPHPGEWGYFFEDDIGLASAGTSASEVTAAVAEESARGRRRLPWLCHFSATLDSEIGPASRRSLMVYLGLCLNKKVSTEPLLRQNTTRAMFHHRADGNCSG